MMRQMMERMCGESEFSPADMCEQMRAAMMKKTRRQLPETPKGSMADASTPRGKHRKSARSRTRRAAAQAHAARRSAPDHI